MCKSGDQVRMFIVVLPGYMWFSEYKTNLITRIHTCKSFRKNIFLSMKKYDAQANLAIHLP
jgi:hypothetical protein